MYCLPEERNEVQRLVASDAAAWRFRHVSEHRVCSVQVFPLSDSRVCSQIQGCFYVYQAAGAGAAGMIENLYGNHACDFG